MQQKYCPKCDSMKDVLEFNIRGIKRKDYRAYCKECHKQYHREYKRKYSREYYKKNSKKLIAASRKSRLKWFYGTSDEEIQSLLLEQDNRCAICDSPFSKTPHIDHNHKTNNVRGLLCGHCNSLLGMAKDDINILKSAIVYLERNRVSISLS